MKISWKWLSTLVDLDGLDPQQIGERLTMAGLEVEGVEPFASDPGLDKVVVGHIVSMERHPDADKLTVCQVDAGEHGVCQIVCGASNMGPGDRVPLALPGARLPGDFKIKKSKLRGVPSEGMLCAEDELGLGRDHDGLMILDADLPLGVPVIKALDLADTVLEIGVTPNRPDALSHLGVSRDVAALTGRALSWPTMAQGWRGACRGQEPEAPAVPWEGLVATAGPEPVEARVSVEIQDPAGCPRYAAALVTGIKVGPSPVWMQARLRAIGQRPINNIVDVTNYVLHECGQPLHAFDADKVAQGRIIVRRAAAGEEIVTLDDQTRKLLPTDLVIADPTGPIAIAGVMGGASTEVSSETTSVIIECAHFDPSSVRPTARRLGLHSESSYRFERGVDPSGVPWFIRRAVELLVATQEALGVTCQVAPGILDVHPRPAQARSVSLPASRYVELIGADPGVARMGQILDALDLTHTVEDGVFQVRIPTLRTDIERPVDVIEEIARIEGFEALEAALPQGTMGFSHTPRKDAAGLHDTIVALADEQGIDRVRHLLLGRGLREAVNYTFVHGGRQAGLGFAASDPRSQAIALRNPLSEDMDVMRTTLLGGLLTNLKHNRSHRVPGANLFEVGRVYLRRDRPESPVPEWVGGKRWETHVEPLRVAALLADPAWEHHSGAARWSMGDLRAMVEAIGRLTARAGLSITPYDGDAPGLLHPFASARVAVEGQEVGWFGALHPELLGTWGIDGEVLAFELDLDRLLASRAAHPTMTAIPRYPSSTRDFALILDASVPYARVEESLVAFGDPRLVNHRLFDVYTGEQVGQGRRSLAIKVTFQDPEGTMGDEALTDLHQRLVAHLRQHLGAELRD